MQFLLVICNLKSIFVIRFVDIQNFLVLKLTGLSFIQVSMCIPVLRLFTRVPVLFYCHFPDLLLASHRTYMQKIYRAPLDWLEEKTSKLFNSTILCITFSLILQLLC